MAPKKAGRKHSPDSKRNQTTLSGRKGEPILPPQELLKRRLKVSGDVSIGTDFPLDVLYALGVIAQEHRDEGLRFALLAWSIYGFPLTGCQAIYDRMIAEGAGDVVAPVGDADADREVWRRRQARILQRMTAILSKVPAQFTAVRAAAQYLEAPRFLVDRVEDRVPRGDAWRDMADLVDGLRRLVRARERPGARSSAEDLAARAAPPPPSAIATEAARSPEAKARHRALDWARRCHPWFTGPLPRMGDIPAHGFKTPSEGQKPTEGF